MHDLRAEQIENKKNYLEEKETVKNSFTAVIENRKKEHQAEMKEITAELRNQLKVLDENYAAGRGQPRMEWYSRHTREERKLTE